MRSKPDTLFLTSEAKSDITEILNYTIENWEVEQTKVYADRLYKGCKLLLENPLLGRQRDGITPGYRIWRIEKILRFTGWSISRFLLSGCCT